MYFRLFKLHVPVVQARNLNICQVSLYILVRGKLQSKWIDLQIQLTNQLIPGGFALIFSILVHFGYRSDFYLALYPLYSMQFMC